MYKKCLKIYTKIREIIGWACIVSAIFISIYLRIKNMDMSETRLLVEFWKEWIGIVILIFGGYFLLRKEK